MSSYSVNRTTTPAAVVSSSLSFAAIYPPPMSSASSYSAASSSYNHYSQPYYTTPTSRPPYSSYAPSQSVSASTNARGDVYVYVQANNTWSLVETPAVGSMSSAASSSSLSPIQSIEAGQITGSDDKQSGLSIPGIVGVVIASIFLLVAIVVGRMWIRHRRNKAARQDARVMREIGRGNGGDWSFENRPPATAPEPRSLVPVTRQALANRTAALGVPHRDSSAWSDDSEMDMMATDGSTLARTLSSRSTSSDATIRTTRDAINHPGYTYQPTVSRSTPSSTLIGSAGRSNISTLRSPFADTASPESNSPISPFADSPISTAPLPRAESRLSTTSSENPFRDPLPAYTVQEAGRAPPDLLSDVPVLGGDGGLERVLQRPPPAYAERDRAAR